MSCDSLRKALDPDNDSSECFSNSTAATENKKRFSITKPSHISVCKVKIDGCLITSQGIRKCDFFFEIGTEPKQFFLVELKGLDLETAVSQLESSYNLLNAKLKASAAQFTAVVVSSAVPATANAKFRLLQEKLRKSKGLKLDRKTNNFDVKISEIH